MTAADRPLSVAELDHVVVRCRDQAAALDFYERILGCVEERRIEPLGLVQLRAGRSMIDLIVERSLLRATIATLVDHHGLARPETADAADLVAEPTPALVPDGSVADRS